MALEVYMKHKQTGVLYGPYMKGRTLVEVDNMARAALGKEPDNDSWLCGWVDRIGRQVAFNVTVEDVDRHVEKAETEYKELVAWLRENFEFGNNHGDQSHYPRL